MKVQVVIPPYMVRDGKAVLPNKAMLPIGPLIIATLLQRMGCSVKVVDLVFHEDWLKHIPAEVPDLVLLSCHTVRNIPSCIVVLAALRETWSRSGRKPHVVLGGNCCIALGIADFSKLGLFVDAVVRGFGHNAEIIDALLSRIPGDLRCEKPSEVLPVPNLSLLGTRTHESYIKHSEGRYPLYAHGIGCQYYKRCGATYCSSTLGYSWTPRHSEEIPEEIAQAKAYGYYELWCVDNLLFVDPAYTLWFDQIVTKQGMKWSGMTRPEIAASQSANYFQQFKSLMEIAMGVEAAELSALRVLNRGVTNNHFEICQEAFSLVNQSSIATNAFVMLDTPTYNDQAFWKLYDFLKAIKAGNVSWSFYNPPEIAILPGQYDFSQYGFYHEPFGMSVVSKHRVIQHAMALSGTWWCGWNINRTEPFFEDESVIGTSFLEAEMLQEKTARSPIGDLWEIWRERERRESQ